MEGDDDSMPSSNLLLHGIGDVVLSLDHQGLSWAPISVSYEIDLTNCCFGCKFDSKIETEIKISDIYAVELFNGVHVKESTPRMGRTKFGSYPRPDMHHLVVHCFRRSSAQKCLWVPQVYIFGHMELEICQKWICKIKECISKEVGRPKNLLVFVHPLSGRGKGCKIWESVYPIFNRANVKTRVIVTKRAGHAFDVTTSLTDEELVSFDGIVAVGGDGFFNEILNGLLLTRHRTPPINSSKEFLPAVNNSLDEQCSSSNGTVDNVLVDDPSDSLPTDDCEDVPLLKCSHDARPRDSNISKQAQPSQAECLSVSSFPNDHFRLGLIPAGSTDSIVISTTGARDAVTSALHIVLGKRVCLDIAQVVRWKTSSTSDHAPSVHYAASFAGYGFYGDVVKESERYRWMGPIRYDYAGTKVFLRHSSYDAEVSFVDIKNSSSLSMNGSTNVADAQSSMESPQKKVCRVSCNVCNEPKDPTQSPDTTGNASSSVLPEKLRWLQRKGRFHCVGAAIMSCRNERAPDGLVADAHLADGFMHLILIKECSRPFYLWHLTKLTRRGSDPLDFNFVEHHRHSPLQHPTMRVSGTWTENSSKHVTFLPEYFVVLLTCLLLDLKSDRSFTQPSIISMEMLF